MNYERLSRILRVKIAESENPSIKLLMVFRLVQSKIPKPEKRDPIWLSAHN